MEEKRAIATVLNGRSYSDLAAEINLFYKGQIVQIMTPVHTESDWWQVMILYIPYEPKKEVKDAKI